MEQYIRYQEFSKIIQLIMKKKTVLVVTKDPLLKKQKIRNKIFMTCNILNVLYGNTRGRSSRGREREGRSYMYLVEQLITTFL